MRGRRGASGLRLLRNEYSTRESVDTTALRRTFLVPDRFAAGREKGGVVYTCSARCGSTRIHVRRIAPTSLNNLGLFSGEWLEATPQSGTAATSRRKCDQGSMEGVGDASQADDLTIMTVR